MTVNEPLDHDSGKMVCSMCGSTRVIKGPFYDENDTVCLECGHREEGEPTIYTAPTEVELKQERADQVQQETQTVLDEFSEVDMTDPDQAEAYLKKLRAAAAKTSKTQGAEKKAKSPRAKKNQASPAPDLEAETSMADDLIMMGIHVYQRRGSSWQQTIHDAKGEKEYRNDNVLVFAHEHSFNESCEGKNCRQIT